MSQQVVAGLGNLYVDEVLYQVGIHPIRVVPDLEDPEISAIFRAIRKTLRVAIERGEQERPLPSSYLLPNREKDVPCPRCSTPISRVVVAGRTTYFCPATSGELPRSLPGAPASRYNRGLGMTSGVTRVRRVPHSPGR